MGSGDVNQADKAVFGMPVSVSLRACESWPRCRVKIQSDEDVKHQIIIELASKARFQVSPIAIST